jgi:hypothetical protein
VVVKIDFAKAFDTIDHDAIIVVMRAKGYPEIFISCVKETLSSGSSDVLLNGVPGKSFQCKRGVRRGDPLSPLFVQGADLLQYLVNFAYLNGILVAPIPIRGDFPIIKYADDAIIVLPSEDEQLQSFKRILNQYAAFTSLKINYSKSSLVPINVSSEEANILAESFGCKLGSMPFTYLGLPLWVIQNSP